MDRRESVGTAGTFENEAIAVDGVQEQCAVPRDVILFTSAYNLKKQSLCANGKISMERFHPLYHRVVRYFATHKSAHPGPSLLKLSTFIDTFFKPCKVAAVPRRFFEYLVVSRYLCYVWSPHCGPIPKGSATADFGTVAATFRWAALSRLSRHDSGWYTVQSNAIRLPDGTQLY
jgi:hypothetical protein